VEIKYWLDVLKDIKNMVFFAEQQLFTSLLKFIFLQVGRKRQTKVYTDD
jgi:hypothetical protein